MVRGNKKMTEIKLNILIDELNKVLAREYQAIIMYTQYSAIVTGIDRIPIVDFFQDERSDEQSHAQYLCDKIAVLGGVPTATAAPVPLRSSTDGILDAVRVAEQDAVNRYTALIDMADEYGDVGLRVSLENIVVDETDHLEKVLRLLGKTR